jgi:hypothetical protein
MLELPMVIGLQATRPCGSRGRDAVQSFADAS